MALETRTHWERFARRELMFLVIFSYTAISIVVTFPAFTSGWVAGLSLLASSLVSVAGGIGLRGCLLVGGAQLGIGIVLASLFLAVGQWLGSNYTVGFFGTLLDGHEWSLIGFLVGLVFTPREMAFGGK